MDPNAVNEAQRKAQERPQQPQFVQIPSSKLEKRSNSMPSRNQDQSPNPSEEENQPRNKLLGGANAAANSGNNNNSANEEPPRPSITNDSNILLDPDVLDDQVIFVTFSWSERVARDMVYLEYNLDNFYCMRPRNSLKL